MVFISSHRLFLSACGACYFNFESLLSNSLHDSKALCSFLVNYCENQCFGSGLDPDSVSSGDSDPDSEYWSASSRVKMTHKNIKSSEILF